MPQGAGAWGVRSLQAQTWAAPDAQGPHMPLIAPISVFLAVDNCPAKHHFAPLLMTLISP